MNKKFVDVMYPLFKILESDPKLNEEMQEYIGTLKLQELIIDQNMNRKEIY